MRSEGSKKGKKKMAPRKVGAPPPEKRFRTIRVSSDVYEMVQQVVGEVRANGWQHYGAERNDVATITSVVAEAITRLTASAS